MKFSFFVDPLVPTIFSFSKCSNEPPEKSLEKRGDRYVWGNEAFTAL